VNATVLQPLPGRTRARLIAAAGILIILLSAGSALLPMAADVPGSMIVGWLLCAAGIIEMGAALMRRAARVAALAAGAVTTAAGLLFLLNRVEHFFPTINVVILWLFVRSLILLLASGGLREAARMWTLIAAATDFLLGLILLTGLGIATLVVTLFGPTPTLVASFAWVLALSFIATGFLLLEVSSCEADD
jgi:uncharacterized membrane protein HdeD (DUF308 family)